jgi:hypothetical protein
MIGEVAFNVADVSHDPDVNHEVWMIHTTDLRFLYIDIYWIL